MTDRQPPPFQLEVDELNRAHNRSAPSQSEISDKLNRYIKKIREREFYEMEENAKDAVRKIVNEEIAKTLTRPWLDIEIDCEKAGIDELRAKEIKDALRQTARKFLWELVVLGEVRNRS